MSSQLNSIPLMAMKPTPSARRSRSFILAARTSWGGLTISYRRLAVGDILAPPRGAGVTARSIARSMVLVFVLALVLAARPNAGAQRQGPQPVPDPAQGDGGVSAFYTWDRQVPATPGRLLRQEPLPEHLLLENASKGLRVLYTSTDGVGGKTPIAASGAVFVPKGHLRAGGRSSRGLTAQRALPMCAPHRGHHDRNAIPTI